MGIGENIKKLRDLRKLTQDQIFRQVGIATSYQSQIENGDRKPGAKTLHKYMDVFGVSEAVLRFGDLPVRIKDDSRREFDALIDDISDFSDDELLELRREARRLRRERKGM